MTERFHELREIWWARTQLKIMTREPTPCIHDILHDLEHAPIHWLMRNMADDCHYFWNFYAWYCPQMIAGVRADMSAKCLSVMMSALLVSIMHWWRPEEKHVGDRLTRWDGIFGAFVRWLTDDANIVSNTETCCKRRATISRGIVGLIATSGIWRISGFRIFHAPNVVFHSRTALPMMMNGVVSTTRCWANSRYCRKELM